MNNTQNKQSTRAYIGLQYMFCVIGYCELLFDWKLEKLGQLGIYNNALVFVSIK